MNYTEKDIEYLLGKKFSPRYDMKLVGNKLTGRVDEIVKVCSGKAVLHVGCCDHLSVIDDKRKNHTWLHGILEENCSYLQGLDICEEAVNYCNTNKYSEIPIIVGDVTESQIPNMNLYDFILMAEMIEHINNPVEFLTKTYTNFKKQGFNGQYIITAPNALGMMRRNIFAKGVERINSDHKYWFSPFTLAKIMVEAGIMPESCEFVQYQACNEDVEITYKSDAILLIGH